MKKNLFTISLAALAMCALMPAQVMADEVQINGLWYDYDTGYQKATVLKYYDNDYYSGDIVIPSVIMCDGVECKVVEIEERAFQDCRDLTSVTIPLSMEDIGECAFYGCTGLTSVVIPDSVETLGQGAFWKCTGLTSVVIGNSLRRINQYTFFGCSSMTSLTIGSGVKYIGSNSFRECKSLTSLEIPDNVSDLEVSSFYGCTSLTTVSIGSGVTVIEMDVFRECSSLTDVYCYAEEVPNTHDYVFYNAPIDQATLHVHAASIESYSKAATWRDFGTIVMVEEQCAAPVIDLVGGKLTFTCATEGVTFKSKVTIADREQEDASVMLAGKVVCHVSVYATKKGCLDSEVVTKDVELNLGTKGDVNGDGDVTPADAIEALYIFFGIDQSSAAHRQPQSPS